MFDKQMMQRGMTKATSDAWCSFAAQDWTVDVALAHSGSQVLSAAGTEMFSATKIPDETVALLGAV